MRIGGLASGMDTDQMVKDLMRVERMKVDRFYQQRQRIEWRKEVYRSNINLVRGFRDNYFDILKPETNFTSSNAFKKMEAVSTDSRVSVTANSNALLGEINFEVLQSATAARADSSGLVTKSDATPLSNSTTMAQLKESLINGDALNFVDGKMEVAINGSKKITINETDTLGQVMSKINTSDAGVRISYSSFSDTFTVVSKNTGAGQITIDQGGDFFTALGMEPDGQGLIGEAGRNAQFKINGAGEKGAEYAERASNTFTVDGITYSINEKVELGEGFTTTIKTTVNEQQIYDNIEKFINDYNKLIDDINGQLNEQVHRGFQPLTDEQKESMSEKEIELWEEKAKSGLLRRDSVLENMLNNMRNALYAQVGDLHLTEIGIQTSNDYRERGKLVLTNGGADLKKAIANDPDKVTELFTKTPSKSYSPNMTKEERAQRFEEGGLAHRLSDILNDNIRTTRDKDGRKGLLIERAGITGDTSEFNNFLDKQLADVNKQIDRMEAILAQREEQYYRRFAAMEKALHTMYSQGDYLMMSMMQGK